MNLSGFKAITFDCYGTLIDWETGILKTISPRLKQCHTSIEDDLVLSAIASVQALRQKIRPAENYRFLLSQCYRVVEDCLGIPGDPVSSTSFGDSIGSWPPFADTIEALRHLQKHFKLGILSNVDNDSLQQTIGLLKAPFAVTVTAEDIGSYKPELPHFEEAFKRFNQIGIDKSEILHVAQSKRHDIAPANRIGLSSVWIDRRHDRDGNGMAVASDAQPSFAFNTLNELVEAHKKYLNEK